MNSKGNAYIIIFSIWLVVFAASSQIMIIAPILPRISVQLNVPEALLGTLVSSYAIMVGLFSIIMGPISDKIGRRKILLIGSGGMTIALGLHVLATDYFTLLAARGLAGMTGGVLSGAAVSYVGDYFPSERRGWANGWIMSGIAMGQIAGIPLGTILADMHGFRAPFLAFGVLMSMAFLLIYVKVPQPDVQRFEGHLTLKNALQKYRDLLRRTEVKAASASYFVMFLSVSSYIIFLPTWLEAQFPEITGASIASLFLVGGIANVMTGPVAGRFSDRFGRKGLVILSCIGFSVITLMTTFVMISFTVAYPLFFLLMVTVAMRISPFQALLTELVVSQQRGSLMSLMVGIGQAGFGLGGAVSGMAYMMGGFTLNTYISGSMILIMAFIVWKFIPETRKVEAAKPDLETELTA